ncbi:sulfatase-like hydrolase/transferase [Candidatus Pelagibacter ubique]|nr:sulfatase-like hydrolase/transferase [Candidatus Pelagibacter ubique]
MDKPIIFLIIDSVRSFKTGLDDRDRLKVMDDFSKDSIEFTNAYCSAPSSVMSASSMFTGICSAYIARNYQDWVFKDKEISSIQSILKKESYSIVSIDNSKESREMMSSLTMPLKKKFFPKGISHADFWTNKDLCKILKNIFTNHNPKKKTFFMLWFDCREDPNTSKHVQEALDIFKENGFYDDSIIFMAADHGYPSPKSGLNKENMKGIGHDMIITEDTIKIPLFLKYPNCSPKKVNTLVSNIDLTPTVLDILKIDKDRLSLKSEGISLLESIENDNTDRIVRIDTRLLSQNNRIIALRLKNYKFIFYVDQVKYELYDLIKDPNELKPEKITSQNQIIFDELKEKLNETEKLINEYHRDAIAKNIILLKDKLLKSKNILIKNKIPLSLFEIIISEINNINSNLDVYHINDDFITSNKKNHLINLEIKTDLKNFDLAFIILEKTNYSFVPQTINTLKNKIKKVMYFDFNMQNLNPIISKWFWPIWKYSLNKNFYKEEPKLILIDLLKIIKTVMFRYVHKKEHKIDIYQEKQMRDRAISNEKISNPKL